MALWNPYTTGYFNNPYEHLAECRTTEPMQIGIHKEWLLFNYKDVREVLRSPAFGVSKLSEYFAQKEPVILEKAACPFLAKGTKTWIMYLDGQDHVRIRTLADAAIRQFNFTPAIERAVAACFEKNKDAAELDVVDIATQIPMYIVEELMGVSGMCSYEQVKRFSHLLAVSQDLFVTKTTYREVNSEFEWAFSFFGELYRKAGANAEPHLLTFLQTVNKEEGFRLSDDEMISLITVIFMAALETTKDTMSVILYEVLKDPSLAVYIEQANEIEINILAEEFLRFASPLQYTVRVAHEDVEINGIRFPKGTRLFLCLASANRDAVVFDNPDTIVPNRKYNPHLSFGSGMHSCLGARVARNEIRSWLKPVTKHLLNYRLAENEPPNWQRTIFMRGLKSLKIERK
ncbi:cytochrome P450 [Lacibacter luteus]|uniref:Cytochrome P450 n=1 Tax=Lacibacter luteus TaxID=2508719 RepID=A0A4Q1CKD1_9BACT|nr:cytochrome P450 [Lacibacter luteus]RXK60834.1 cytochrome P450 [Lacibacter luteus]